MYPGKDRKDESNQTTEILEMSRLVEDPKFLSPIPGIPWSVAVWLRPLLELDHPFVVMKNEREEYFCRPFCTSFYRPLIYL